MNFEKIDNSLEKTSVSNAETNFSQLEKNISVEKISDVTPENFSDFIKSLEDVESNDLPKNLEINPVMNPEIRDDVPGFEGQDVLVCGNPMEVGEQLNHRQGDNSYGAEGNCGLVSASNVLNLVGRESIDEEKITGYAIANGECEYDQFTPPIDCGGTNLDNMQNILNDFGVPNEVIDSFDDRGSIEAVAKRLEAGCVGIMTVNAGELWDDPCSVGSGWANHAVTLTGTIRDSETGELQALTICDSGNGNACHVVPYEKLEACYEYVPGAAVILSKEPMREI